MPITLRHDAAAVALPANSANRKYGQQLVLQQQQQRQQQTLQQQQQKYQGYQAGLDRLFDVNRQANQNAFQFERDRQQNAFMMDRDQVEFARQAQQAEVARQQAFMDDARKQSGRFIMDAIENNEYDPVTARELKQNLVDEAEALGNPKLDATQRAEALQALRARRATLSANRLPKAPPPTPQEQFDQGIVTDQNTGMRYRQNAKGDYEPLEQQQQRPKSADEAFRADPKTRDKYMEDAKAIKTKGGAEPLTEVSRKEAMALAQRLWEEDNNIGTPTAAPELPGSTPAAAPGASKSILEQPMAALPERGLPPSPANPTGQPMAQLPDPGQPPAPEQPLTAQPPAPGQPPSPAAPTADAAEYDAQMTKQGYQLKTAADGSPYYYKDAPASQAEVRLPSALGQQNDEQMTGSGYKLVTPGGDRNPYYYKDANPPVAPAPQPQAQPPASPASRAPATSRFTPPGLAPKEAEARQQVLDLPADQRITSLMPYSSDPLLAGRTIDEALADPEVRKIYDEEIVADAKRRGVKPPEYREAMLAVFDEALTGEVLNGGVSMPQQNYAGMHVDDIKDQKAKAEVDKMPRPKSPDEIISIRGPYFVDPNGIIRSTKKQA